MHIPLWFNAHSITQVFSFSSIFVERISGLGDFIFNYISPTTVSAGPLSMGVIKAVLFKKVPIKLGSIKKEPTGKNQKRA